MKDSGRKTKGKWAGWHPRRSKTKNKVKSLLRSMAGTMGRVVNLGEKGASGKRESGENEDKGKRKATVCPKEAKFTLRGHHSNYRSELLENAREKPLDYSGKKK